MPEPEPLTAEQVVAFARMIHAGAPVEEAAKYFCDALISREALQACARVWMAQPEVMEEYARLSGGVSFEAIKDRGARREYALEKHYDEMAFFLYTTNYAELTGPDKTKADTCREALEKKLAGLAGTDPLVEFWQDLLRTKKRVASDSDEVQLQ